jgi:hypothetical protein
MMLEMNITSDNPHFSQEHRLFGRGYLLEFAWIEEEKMWVMHLYDDREEPLALGLRVSTNWPIFVDAKTGMTLFLYPKSPRAILDRASLHKDFLLVACELV